MKEETLGQVFKRYREEAGLKIEQVEKETKISCRMILALEKDDYNILPEDLFTKNIIRSYAEYLSLDYNKLLNLYEEGQAQKKETQATREQKGFKVYITPQIFRYIIIGLLVSIFLVYLGLQINKIFTPPELIIYEPPQSLVTAQNFIEIKGKTEKEARVFINGKEIYIDTNGKFLATLDLQKGLNTIKITALKKHSKESVVFRQILVQ
jgi:transcriptional regulator with XRE-family HTH domain